MKNRKRTKGTTRTPEAVGGSLRDVQWPKFLSSPEADLLEQLYVPALSRAIRYDRCCAYFSSRVLSLAARGFGKFIETLLRLGSEAPRPAARLIVNEHLEPEDVEALLATGDTRALERKLMRRLTTPTEALEKRRLEMLAWLVQQGLLEVRVGVPRRGVGLLHAKFGVVVDRQGDKLTFMGSDNETGEAVVANYELLTLAPSWEDAELAERFCAEFERLWANEHAEVLTLPLPEAVRLKLIKMAPQEAPGAEPVTSMDLAKAAMVWQFLAAAPYLENGGATCDATAPTNPWPHQTRVVEETASAFPEGRLLCDEVGLGKTIEAILILRRLMAGRGVRRALLLLPAGLMRQWQEELREKGGLLVPIYDKGFSSHPDGRKEQMDARTALARDGLWIVSREWARLEQNRPLLFQAPPWDLVLMDEAHAARRKEPDENAFNQGNLLLELLRELQLRGHARGFLLLSATPMQIEPWEPWDLLAILGVGGNWLASFDRVRTYYAVLASLEAGRSPSLDQLRIVRSLLTQDGDERHPVGLLTRRDAEKLRQQSPLAKRMHRSTREKLREYFQNGWLEHGPPVREVQDEVYNFETAEERQAYDQITRYIDRRYEQLERERGGKGFVMTIYRRRAASSPRALRKSLERRLEALRSVMECRAFDESSVVEIEEALLMDLADADLEERVDLALPPNEHMARREYSEIEKLLAKLDELGGMDSKLSRFMKVLYNVEADGRSVLVFTEYTDTMEYLRDKLTPLWDKKVACYSGRGGERYEDGQWVRATKGEITELLERGEIRVLICTDAASEGLNLQAAGALINYDLPWNPSRVEQRIGRIDRIGQRHRTLPVVNLFLENSVDMSVYSALRRRCRLFEQFIGDMQPVLALAREVLRRAAVNGRDAENRIERIADEVESRAEIRAAFSASSVLDSVPTGPEPGATRDDVRAALDELASLECALKVKTPRKGVWRIRGLGGKAVDVALDADVLERYSNAIPVTLWEELPAYIAGKLSGTLPALPLVTAEWRKGSYCCREAWWAGPVPVRVTTLGKLRELMAKWDGSAVAPEQITHTEVEARRRARRRAEEAAREATERFRAGLQQQVDAASARLRRALARHLRLYGSGDLNLLWRRLIDAQGERSDWCRLAREYLGDYVDWTEEEREDAKRHAADLPASKRLPTSLAPEVEAAVRDPRWKARKTVGCF